MRGLTVVPGAPVHKFMPPLADILMLTSLPVLLVASAFVSGSETALFSLTAHQRKRLSQSGTVAGTAVDTLFSETRGLLVTLLLANMTVNVCYFVISTVLLTHLQRGSSVGVGLIAVLAVLPLILLILVGEVIPKLVASKHTQQWTRLAAVPLLIMHRVIGPIRVVTISLVVTPLSRLIAPRRKPSALSSDELGHLLQLSQRHGGIDHSEEYMLQQVFELGQLKVKDLMTPRVDVVAFDISDPVAELMELIRETRHSKIIVHRGDLDDIAGVIHARQVLLGDPQTPQEVTGLIRQVPFVPEVQRADRLLVQFRKRGTTMAVAVDEYGGTAGIVTLEDVVEQMVGDIIGPDDPEQEPEVVVISEGHWRVSANLGVHEWVDMMGQIGGFWAEAKQVGISTVGGLVMANLGRVAKVGDRVAIGDVEIEVESMEGSRIAKVIIVLNPKNAKVNNGIRSGEPG